MIKKYLSLTPVEAVQWNGTNFKEIQEFCGDTKVSMVGTKGLRIDAKNSRFVFPNNYIVKTLGGFFIFDEKEFLKSYNEF